MIIETSAVAFRQNLEDLLNQVHSRNDSILVNKDGRSIAALVNARLFERIRRMQARFGALSERLECGFEGVPQGEGLTEIEAALVVERRVSLTPPRSSARARRP